MGLTKTLKVDLWNKNKPKDTTYVWKCTQDRCYGKRVPAVIGLYNGQGIRIGDFSGDGVCAECLPNFIKNKDRLIYKGLFIPITLPEPVRRSVMQLFIVIYKSLEVSFK